MSSHLRHCPKHRKPLPCAHCALVAKPATICEPAAAKAKPVPRAMIAPEVRFAIEETLATAPVNVPVKQLETVDVETSQDTKTAKVVEGRDVDDAVEQQAFADEKKAFADKFKRKPKSSKMLVPPKRESTKQPSYLKSVAQPLVPSNNPQAPYGYDDNDRPIGVPVPKPSSVPTNLPKSNLPPGPHKFSGNNIRVGNLASGGHNGSWGCTTVVSETEAALRSFFGNERIPDTFNVKPSRRHYEFVDYRTMFSLSHSDLVGLLGAQIGTERIADVLDTTQPKQKILKSSANLKQEINTAETAACVRETRIAEIGDLIKESENLIDSWSVHKMKLQRPDDILDKATRERYKRDEQKKISRLEKERSDLRKQLSADTRRIVELQKRLVTWGSRDEDYDEQYPRVTREYPKHFRDRFVPPEIDEFKGYLPPGYDYGTDAYVQLVHVYEVGVDTVFKGWKRFANELVLQAIGFGLIQPSRALLKKHPTLTTYVEFDLNGSLANYLRKYWENPDAANAEPDEDIDPDDEVENALIFKTGGAQIGGQVYSAGTRWNGNQRSLSSFDGPIGRGTYEPGDGGENDHSDDSAEDSGSYQPG